MAHRERNAYRVHRIIELRMYYLRGVDSGLPISVEQDVAAERAMPLDEVVPAVPHEVGLPVSQEGKDHGPLVQRAIRSRDIAQGTSLRTGRGI